VTRCETCRFWTATHKMADTSEVAGACRFDPPEPGPGNGLGRWPFTLAAHWCGKHESRYGEAANMPVLHDRLKA
jgi:hypothetical protein